MQKAGQTAGVLLFAILTTFGRDVGDDLGIRLSGVAGCVLCVMAALLLTRYRADVIEADSSVEERV